MVKRIISAMLSFIICLELFPAAAFAKETEAFDLYQEAVRATTSSGSWRENLSVVADMDVSEGSTRTEATVKMNSIMDICNYSENDLSSLQMSGSANMSVMNQSYVWQIQYEDGVAHYEYTEPVQKSADIKMDPSYFNFYTLTQDMLEEAEAFGNQITFTVPGSRMAESGIAAMDLMPGISKLHYGDVRIKITIDKETGAIDTILMLFHASMTYQENEAEVDYEINYQFSGADNTITSDSDTPDFNESEEDSPDMEDGIVLYSDYTNLSLGKNSIITLSAGLIVDGRQAEDASGIAFWAEDSSILGVYDTGIQENRRYVEFKGIKEGTTIVSFTDSDTGYTAEVPVTVYDNNYLSYTLDSVPTKYVDKYPNNIYNANGLYIDNYSYTVNEDKTADVSFDVYNTNYTYSVVEVFKENGELDRAVLIEKMGAINTGLKEALLDNALGIIRDIKNKTYFTYRQESGFSKKTPIEVKVPANGYIKICSNPKESFFVNIINSADILLSLASFANKIKNYDVNSPEFCGELTKKIFKEEVYAELIKDGNKLPEKFWKKFGKKVIFSPKSLGIFSDTIANNIDALDLGELIAETAEDFGWDIFENVFEYFSGPVKTALKSIFAMGKMENIIGQCADFTKSLDVGSIYIQNQGGGIRSSQQITVNSDKDFSADTALNVFQVIPDQNLLAAIEEENPGLYKKMVKGVNYTYNISLLRNGEELQPDTEVTVYIPVPEDMLLSAYAKRAKVYRVEKDGTLTEMNTEIKDGCFVFKTTHFSLYTLIGDAALPIIAIGICAAAIVCLAVIILLIVRKKKKKRKINGAVSGEGFMRCTKCGREINENIKFCKYCGAPVLKALEAPEVQDEYTVKKKTPIGKKIRRICVVILLLFAVGFVVLAVLYFMKDRDKEEQEAAEAEVISTEEPMPSNETAKNPIEEPLEETEPPVSEEPPVMEDTALDTEREEQVSRIRERYNDIVSSIAADSYEKIIVRPGVTGYYDNSGLKSIVAVKGTEGVDYNRIYCYDNNSLIYSYYEGEDAHKFYFSDGLLIDWKYFPDSANTQDMIDYGTKDSFEYPIWEKEVFSASEDFADSWENAILYGVREYIFEGSDIRYISKSELDGFTKEECRLARNEIYARHGRKFDDEELQSYFNQFAWYQPSINPDDFKESMLNKYEIANRDLIIEYEKEQGYRQ